MSPITLDAFDQLMSGTIILMVLVIAYLKGGLAERDRHIETLQRHLAFLHGIVGEDETHD